jgi:AraC-like DNA-binding protein
MSSRTTSSAWFKGVIDVLESEGLDIPAIMAAAGIDPAVLQDPDARLPTEKMSRLWRAAAEISGDPNVGLASALVPKPGNFDIVGYAMLSSRDLRAALHSFSRHMRLVSDAAEITLEDRGKTVLVRFDLHGGREPVPRQRIEFDLLTLLTFCRWVSGRPIAPVSLSMQPPEPPDARLLAQTFRCPLSFGSPFNGLVWSREDVDAPLPACNPSVAELHDKLLQERLAAYDGLAIGHRVRKQIALGLSTGEPRREAVARALNLSDRTLRRRLQDEGVTFEQLLDMTRCDLAQHYLARPNLTIAEVAYLLGFSEPGAFNRACKRWFELPPRQFREQHSAGVARRA